MEVVVNKDSKFLIANDEHKNFTESNELVGAGTKLIGTPKTIKGLRRGEPFDYRLFVTNDNKIIYLKNVDKMNTEVTLGADSQRSSTVVNLVPGETFNKVKTTGLIIGAIAGFAYAKYKKHDMKKIATFIAIGAVVGYASAYVVDRNKKGLIKVGK